MDGRRVGAEECRRLFNGPLPARMQAVLRLVQGPRLLDVGAYDGSFLTAVLAAHPEIDALATDYDAENLRIARFLHPEHADRLREGSAYDLPFSDASFDCVTFQEVIEHLEGAAAAIKEINRVLRPGGRLIVTTPNPLYWRDVRDHVRGELAARIRHRPPALSTAVYFEASEWNRHLYAWTPQTLLTLLHVNGFAYRWHGYAHDETGPLPRILMSLAPFLGPVTILEAEKTGQAPLRLV